MSRFEHTDATIEVVVGLDFGSEDSYLSSFKIGDKEVDFGFKDMWLSDLEGLGYVSFPKEKGKYKIKAVYDDLLDTIIELHSVEKIT